MNASSQLLALGIALGIAGSAGILLYPVANRRARARGARSHWKVGWIVAFPSMTAMFAGWILLAWVGPHVLQKWTVAPGLVLFVAGAVVYFASARLVGRLCGPKRYSLDLHTFGIYRWVRHPQGLGLVLLSIGAALASGSIPFYTTLPFWVGVWIAYTYVEERFELLPTFQRSYEEYRQSTPRILPRPGKLARAALAWARKRGATLPTADRRRAAARHAREPSAPDLHDQPVVSRRKGSAGARGALDALAGKRPRRRRRPHERPQRSGKS